MKRILVGIMCCCLIAIPAWSQSQNPAQNPMANLSYFVAAFICLWVILIGYFSYLRTQMKQITLDIQRLEARSDLNRADL